LFTAAAAAAAANALSYCIAQQCDAAGCSAMQCKSPHDFGIDLV